MAIGEWELGRKIKGKNNENDRKRRTERGSVI